MNPAALQRIGSFMAPFDELRRFKIVEDVALGNRLNLTSSGAVRAVVLTGIGALAIGAAVSAFAVEQNAAPNLKPNASFNAKWDRCEALARQRGTPPGNIGYGDFIHDCLNISPSHSRMEVRR
jgi:hypothetical protein